MRLPRLPAVFSHALFLGGFAMTNGCAQTPIKPSIDPGRLRPSAQFTFPEATRFLDSAITSGAAPGAVLGVSLNGRWFIHGTGQIGVGVPAVPDSATEYDLASLTKVIGLTTAMMIAVDSGLIDLDAPIQRYVPAFTGPGKERVTVRMLMVHASGLPAWRPLYRETETRADALALVDTTALDTVPGTRFVYSDLGAIVLTQAVEAVLHQRIDSLLANRVFQPLDMTSTRYLPPASWLPRIAPTENDPWRGRLLRGEVHDENASRLGGVSGHAGLFSTVPDLLRFGDWLIQCSKGFSTVGTSKPAVPLPHCLWDFSHRQNIPPGSSRAIGWDTPSAGSSAGSLLSAESIWHTGFTGTAIWIDPTRDLVIVLLTNRVNPTRENNRMGPVRRGVTDAVVRELNRQAGGSLHQ
ncbi:MAG: serine hydrolase domain-containing protein [Gemmatimonadota bacterium]